MLAGRLFWKDMRSSTLWARGESINFWEGKPITRSKLTDSRMAMVNAAGLNHRNTHGEGTTRDCQDPPRNC